VRKVNDRTIAISARAVRYFEGREVNLRIRKLCADTVLATHQK
jgi:hypothetical protein